MSQNAKKCKYYDEYISFGFICRGREGEQKPLCVLCYETLSNESMKPAKLCRHLETKHKEHINKLVEYFQRRQQELLSIQNSIEKIATGCDNKNAVFASYDVSLLIAKSGKPHTIAEELILPAAKAIVSRMHGDKVAKDYDMISLSNTTVKWRIEDMSDNVTNQLVERVLKSQYYSLQLDESTDISNSAYLLAFIRYDFDGTISEDFLLCQSLPTHTTGESIFNSLNDFIIANEIGWSKCVGVSTDGAPAMSGKYRELKGNIQTIIPNVKRTHCCIHRESLAARKMLGKLKTTLDEAVKVVNFIKAHPLNSRIFSVLCKEMGSAHEQLLSHSQVHWMFHGKVLTHIFEFRDEIRLFLHDKSFHGSEWFNNFSWLAMVAYMSDIFTYLNGLNLNLQGRSVTIFKVEDKVEAMIMKLDLWSEHLQSGVFESFPTLCDFLAASDDELSEEIRNLSIQHLQDLKKSLRDYFPLPDANNKWIRDPFHVDVKNVKDLIANEENSFVELSCDTLLRSSFIQYDLSHFWLHVKNEYPELASKALRYLMPFPTKHLCEQAFSELFYIKSKYRNRMNVEPHLHLKLSAIEPEIRNIVSTKQHQPSY